MLWKLRTALSSISLLFSLGVASETAIVFAQSPGTFIATGNMIVPRISPTATLLANGKVLIAGGFTFARLPSSSAWMQVMPNSTIRLVAPSRLWAPRLWFVPKAACCFPMVEFCLQKAIRLEHWPAWSCTILPLETST